MEQRGKSSSMHNTMREVELRMRERKMSCNVMMLQQIFGAKIARNAKI